MSGFGLTFISLTDAIANHARGSPVKTAVVAGEQRLTWWELNRSINRVAKGLRLAGPRPGTGAKPGQVVRGSGYRARDAR